MFKKIILFFGLLFSMQICGEEFKDIIHANNRLAFSLYHTLGDKNCFFSPYSIETCFSLIYFGAKGKTEEEMKKALFLKIDKNKLPLELSQMQAYYQKEFVVANGIWIESLLNLKTPYVQFLSNMNVELQKINFISSFATDEINQWTETKTNHKIKHLLSSTDLDPYTKMVIVNAIYLKREWAIPFDSYLTKDDTFYVTTQNEIKLPMMQHTCYYPYFENDDMQVISLPLKSDNMPLAMVIFLPKQMKAASFLTLKNYNLAMNKLENTRVILKLPKFTINQKYDLQSLLNMPTAFSTSANFSDLTDDTSLYINRALHQSYLKIDEDGLEAAAATAISMNATSCAPQDEPVIYFTADHPFAFAIVDTNNKTILFMGTFDGK